MRHLLPLLLLLATAGCVKPAPPIAAASPAAVTLAPVRTDFETSEVLAAPERLQTALSDELTSRNLQPRLVSDDQLVQLFGSNRSTRWRLTQLATHDSGAELLVLVESESTFYAQMAGRYRWTVHTTVSLAELDHLDSPITREFEVPVFLQFHHQKADDALAEATPTIERRLGEVLDEYLSR